MSIADMPVSALLGLTDIETIKAKYTEILGERVHSDGTHSLHTKGVFDGMAIILTAISHSIGERKKLSGPATGPTDKP